MTMSRETGMSLREDTIDRIGVIDQISSRYRTIDPKKCKGTIKEMIHSHHQIWWWFNIWRDSIDSTRKGWVGFICWKIPEEGYLISQNQWMMIIIIKSGSHFFNNKQTKYKIQTVWSFPNWWKFIKKVRYQTMICRVIDKGDHPSFKI